MFSRSDDTSCTTRRRWTRDPPLSTVLMPTLDPAALQYSACMSETTSSLMSQDMSHFSEEDEAALLACAASVPSARFEYPDLGLVTVQGACDSSLSLSSPSRSGDGSHATSDDEQTFPDSYLLPVTELILLRACGRIGERIQCNDRVWQLDATSTFVDGTMSLLSSSMLPPSWQPTQSQSTLPHHPIVDLLPWPSVRDRLLLIMSLPDALKPATVGTGGMAVVQLAYDMEDSSEGLRVWGEDVYDSAAWEVGQVLFEKWWFVFDRQVIERSNYWRRMRGAPDLKLPSRVEELGG
ncbi:hypothetical protein Micbo1qcDRAFT_168787 [Microdochium bolleyi]|uniref:Uncharacterized protein n=1 Tax=Microdochium bolleyi TaxID=196109 RepID=A0A136IMI1_9PEZI|nr:hypothetical protein Micbo1qcDRAFT_168787 [Microdochium bolleyi]